MIWCYGVTNRSNEPGVSMISTPSCNHSSMVVSLTLHCLLLCVHDVARNDALNVANGTDDDNDDDAAARARLCLVA